MVVIAIEIVIQVIVGIRREIVRCKIINRCIVKEFSVRIKKLVAIVIEAKNTVMITKARNINIIISKTCVNMEIIETVIAVAVESNSFICFKSFILV